MREASQRQDIEILLQMAFGRPRVDFSRPKTDPGIMDFADCRVAKIISRVDFYIFSPTPDIGGASPPTSLNKMFT